MFKYIYTLVIIGIIGIDGKTNKNGFKMFTIVSQTATKQSFGCARSPRWRVRRLIDAAPLRWCDLQR